MSEQKVNSKEYEFQPSVFNVMIAEVNFVLTLWPIFNFVAQISGFPR